MPRIMFHCWEYPPQGSGIGGYIAEMSAALRSAGHWVVVVAARAEGYPDREEVPGGVIYRIYNRHDLRDHGVTRRVLELAREHHIDWIECADHWGEAAPLLRQRKRPPVVVKMHYNDVLRFPRYAQAWYGWQRFMIDLACLRQYSAISAERYTIEHCDVLIASCQRILHEARRQGLRIPSRHLTLPNPIRTLPAWQNEEAKKPTLLMIARFDIGKGIAYLPDLVKQLIVRYPGLRIELIGRDSYARGLGSVRRWFERRLGPARSCVHMLGAVDDQALQAAYRRAWVVIVPSRWDTFPQVVLEAMARSKPVVASPHGGMPEMLKGTLNPVVEPGTPAFARAIDAFLDDPALRLAAGQSGLWRAKKYYAPDVLAKRYIESVAPFL